VRRERVLFVHPDLHVLAGDLRAMLMFADTFKMMGYDVLFLYTDIRPHKDRYFRLEEIYDYHTISYLRNNPCIPLGIRLCGDFQEIEHRNLRPQVYDYMIKLREFDILFTDQVPIAYFGDDDARFKTILYVHYPDRPAGPRNVMVWTNSRYIKKLVMDNWNIVPEVVYPPLNLSFYKSRRLDDRDYDIVFFGQMYYTKRHFLAEKFADKGYRVAVMGARVERGVNIKRNKNIDVYRNVTVDKYVDILSRSKVYIHARPGEHFGITITEAMACGCPIVVHKSGGQWTDIAVYGKYGRGFSTLQELYDNVKRLLEDRDLWYKYHYLSLERVKTFSMDTVASKIRLILGRM